VPIYAPRRLAAPAHGLFAAHRSSARSWHGSFGHLGKVGSNLNQLAYAYNRDRTLPGLPELVAMRQQVVELRDALMKALGRAGHPGAGQSDDY
jgi:hypothetical protein